MVVGIASVLLLMTAPGVASATGPAAAPASEGRPTSAVVVDDDRAQCPQADTTSIQGGVDRARRGDRVVVCPGTYRERVVVARTLTLEGTPDAVAAVDCLDPSSTLPGAVDDTRFAVLEPPAEGEGTLLRLEADGIRVSGLVVQGLRDTTAETPAPGAPLFDAAVAVSDAWSGIRLDRNLVQDSTLGVELGSSASRVDGNCFRDNDWNLANQRYSLVDARIDHNTSVRTDVIGWEIGWFYRPAARVRLDHNVSHSAGAFAGIYVDNVQDVTVVDNEVHAENQGVYVAPGSARVRIADNVITNDGGSTGVTGVVVVSPDTAPATTGLVITGNRVSGMGTASGRGILLAPNAQPAGAVVTDNVVTDNVEGIALGPGNHAVRVAGNTALRNRINGIRVSAGATLNRLTDNTALGNGTDARDGGLLAEGATSTSNQWIRTTCRTSVPAGLCTPPAVVGSVG
jgi:parallel beta-helix repeat protein